MEKSFVGNDSVCNPECGARQQLNEANLPGPSPEQVCNASAAMLALGERAVEACPLEQIADGL